MPPRRSPRRARVPEPPPLPPRVGRYVVAGKQRVLGKATGEVVELSEEHARRLLHAGHVRPEPPPEETNETAEPRQSAGLSDEPADRPKDVKE